MGGCWVLGRPGRVLSSLEMSRVVGQLSCHEKSVSGLGQGRECWKSVQAEATGNVMGKRSPLEGQEVGGAGVRGKAGGELRSPCTGSCGSL